MAGLYDAMNAYRQTPESQKSSSRRLAEGAHFIGDTWNAAGRFIDDEIIKPVMAGSLSTLNEYDKIKQERGEQGALSSSIDFQKEFPEITNEYGGAAVQAALSDNMIVASKEAVGKAAGVVDSLVTRGVSKDQAIGMAKKESNNNPDVIAAVGSEYDAASKTAPPTGPVNDPGVSNITSKVQANVNGNDPTDNSISDEDLAAANADESDIYASAIDKTANKLHSQHITPKNWYESNSFNMSLIRFGLGLMSGEDYATAFSYAAQDYTKLSGREKREAYRDELLSDGYREADIMSWIEDGNSNILKKPEGRDTFEQFTEKDGSIWQRNLGTRAVTKLQDATKPEGVTYQTFNGKVHVMDKQGNPVRVLGEAGAGSGGKGSGKSGKGPTEAESKARFGGSRAKAAVNVWNDRYYNKGEYPLASRIGTFYTGLADESQIKNAYGVTFGEEERAAANQERSFLAGVLRPESGAAVSNSEWNNYGGIFFDRFGDSDQVRNQKAWLRDMTIVALDKAGNDFTEENQEVEAKKIIDFMSMNAGRVVEYNPERGAVKFSDGKWYNADFINLR